MSMIKNIGLTVLISAIFIGTLLLVLNFFPPAGNSNIEVIHLFIALFPLLVLLILSGKLAGITGPGGIGLTFKEEARKQISPELSKAKIEVQPENEITKGSVRKVQVDFGDSPPTTLTFVANGGYFYSNDDIKEYLEKLGKFSAFKHILFTDIGGEFQGFMPAEAFKDLIDKDEINIANEISSGAILKHPKTNTGSVRIDSSNQQALNEMDRLDRNMLAVVDRHERFVGVVYQDEIVRKVLANIMRQV